MYYVSDKKSGAVNYVRDVATSWHPEGPQWVRYHFSKLAFSYSFCFQMGYPDHHQPKVSRYDLVQFP